MTPGQPGAQPLESKAQAEMGRPIVELLKTTFHSAQLTGSPSDERERPFGSHLPIPAIEQQLAVKFAAIKGTAIVDLTSGLDPRRTRLRKPLAAPLGSQDTADVLEEGAFRGASKDDIGKERTIAAKAAGQAEAFRHAGGLFHEHGAFCRVLSVPKRFH